MAGGVLHVTRNFPPLWGGMERLNWHLAHELRRHASMHVVAPQGAAALAPEGVAIVEAPLAPLSRFLAGALVCALRLARRIRPEVVLAGSGLTAPIAYLAARVSGARAAAYVHGLDLAVRHPVYRALWLPALRRMDRIIANSRATATLAERQGIAASRIAIVPPGVAMPQQTAEARAALRAAFRARHGLGDRPVLLTVGRLTRRKGVSAFVRETLSQIVAARPDVCLVVVGDAPKAALAAEPDPPAAIQAAAEAAGVADHVHCVGPLFGDDLEAAWSAADVHVFPVRHDPNDPEGFGMVAIEAAAHGVPTVAYATGGVVDAVSDGQSGALVPPGDAAAFAAAALRLLDAPPGAAPCRAFAQRFAWETFGRKIIAALALRSGEA